MRDDYLRLLLRRLASTVPGVLAGVRAMTLSARSATPGRRENYEDTFTHLAMTVVALAILVCFAVPAAASSGAVLYADLSTLPNQPAKAFDMLLTSGENGFGRGLYVSSDFVGPHQLLRITGPDHISVVTDGLGVNESLIFAGASYGGGMFVTQPNDLCIRRLLPDGTLSTFAMLGTGPLGPSGMAYHPDGTLLVTNAYGGNILRVAPDGVSSVFAVLPGTGPESRPFGIAALPPVLAAQFGGPLLVGTFETPLETHDDKVYVLSDDGQIVREVARGLDHLEYMTPSPGGPFEPGVFLAEFGTDVNGSGRVSLLKPDGTIIPIVTGVNATRVVFDTAGILSDVPTMYIADMNANITGEPEPSGSLPSRILAYAVPEPGGLILLGTSAIGLWVNVLAKRVKRRMQ